MNRLQAGALAALACLAAGVAGAGHEVPYYPSFYPQEIRLEPMDPERAGKEFANPTDPLHAYVGATPRFAGEPPAHLKPVVSLGAFITVRADPKSERLKDRDARCLAVTGAAATLANERDVIAHPYPVTPFHADYVGHVDRVPTVRPANPAPGPIDPDLRLEQVGIDEVMRKGGSGFGLWLSPPWAKEGWFQAYHLLRSAVGDPAEQKRADEVFERLTHDEVKDAAERINLERDLVAALTRNCERAVIGYRLRREVHNDEFSNGVQNIAFDSQTGFNSPVFVRTVKLKDLPWNGWLRLGIATRADAAWNPVAGFTDAVGRLVWATVGDDAFVAIPYNSQWVQNRVEVLPEKRPAARQSIRIPAEALIVEPDGRLAVAGSGQAAMMKVTFKVLASAFQDGSSMETADLVYPYALAQRWGGTPGGATFDPEIAAATALMREQFKGARIVRVEETKLPIADLVFTYRSPIVEVYLDAAGTDEQQNALFAPPWSSVPWHLLALMEAAVERGQAAFSRTEAERRGLPWLDLVRDPAQLARLRALIKEFAAAGYRPAALETLVTADAAKARWQALEKFVEATGHLLVTNGPYKLRSHSPETYTFDVIREFTYPIGLGTFDFYAYPPKAFVTRAEHIGNRVLLTAEVEIAVKQQRDRRIVRMPLKRETLRETLPIRPISRFVVIGGDGRVAAAGMASREPDGRFAATLPALASGDYRFFGGIFLDGNTISPDIGQIGFRVN